MTYLIICDMFDYKKTPSLWTQFFSIWRGIILDFLKNNQLRGYAFFVGIKIKPRDLLET